MWLTGILVSQPGIERMLPTGEVWRPNYWTSREVPTNDSLIPSPCYQSSHFLSCFINGFSFVKFQTRPTH